MCIHTMKLLKSHVGNTKYKDSDYQVNLLE